MKYLAIVQARLGSKRLPEKVLKKIKNLTLVEVLLKRLAKSLLVSKIVVAIPQTKENDKLYKFLIKKKYCCERGSEKNVLSRFLAVAKKYNPQNIVRITADCPLIDPDLVDKTIRAHARGKLDYADNRGSNSYPSGFDVQVCKSSVLKKIFKKKLNSYDREHVMTYIQKGNEFKKKSLSAGKFKSDHHLSVDSNNDLKKIRKVFGNFYPNLNFTYKNVIKFLNDNDKNKKK